MTQPLPDVDVAVIGGGMVGATLALAAAHTGFSVRVIEAHPPGVDGQPSYDDRATALSWGSRRMLDDLGVWADLAPHAEPIRRIHVSQRGYLGATRMDHHDSGVEALGYVLINRHLGPVLHQALEASGVAVTTPAQLLDYQEGEDHLILKVRQGQEERSLGARLVVGADGTGSRLRALAGIDVHESPYEGSAIIANVTPGQDHQGVAYERFTDEGPIALLPLTRGPDHERRCSLVWVRPQEQVARTLGWSDREFLARLQERFGHRLGCFRKVGQRAAYPLSLIRAKRDTAPRVVLVGNASHTIHPVAGQGFNLGLRDVRTLADLLAQARVDGEDPGSPALLSDYASRREGDLNTVIQATDALARLFATPFSPLAHLRGAGLMLLDLCGPLRRQVARKAMGL
ncbi:2-octaprenyl-6-methoxyphenyl hydroxylase [Ectothiorhodospira haloalkaliphila]|uniref:2-octaprenyl-6-methoxyphenyl hydroxylase n=1 Tax=Ectothiorhodospira haloalkaliphila TaxID=421628 RepID=UPI001EE8F5A8|nr:2-octaprenyl-6-methoxyphenyl hydroxylase [Ectothiorhodospira haloalkaliphila]MCG5523932.1 2-octaprenyl-6-methoxyphenyl hydroxylase [Ectothiorhodospira haloalkaliphila]